VNAEQERRREHATQLHSWAVRRRISLRRCDFGRKGNLYGTTLRGGSSDDGTVYELEADGTLTLLYSFTNQSDGEYPYGGVIMDAQCNLYETAEQGGDPKCGKEGYYGCGTVWQITSQSR
jgi:uncharacterized repeat protein (TIGR03803 family)